MQFAIQTTLDQTIGYLGENGWTTKHPEVTLYPSRPKALAAMATIAMLEEEEDPEAYSIEEVADEAEFRARPNTW